MALRGEAYEYSVVTIQRGSCAFSVTSIVQSMQVVPKRSLLKYGTLS